MRPDFISGPYRAPKPTTPNQMAWIWFGVALAGWIAFFMK